ncbi:hypothetical protein [Citrobacter koseri]|uniref:hypothetical protein n=1 Tax=Citrobacter koseri TaxID=545 RepID=UPI000AFE8123|nr:hypothetical protein [Citrobacter koseri]
MFFDWLSIEQDFGFQLPILSDVAYQRIHLESGEASALSQPTFQHRGSFCDVVSISIRGSVLKMTGNPSRWGGLIIYLAYLLLMLALWFSIRSFLILNCLFSQNALD